MPRKKIKELFYNDTIFSLYDDGTFVIKNINMRFNCLHYNVGEIPIICEFLQDILKEYIEFQKIIGIQEAFDIFLDSIANAAMTKESKEKIKKFGEVMKKYLK